MSSLVQPRRCARWSEYKEIRYTVAPPRDSTSASAPRSRAASGLSGPGAIAVRSACTNTCSTRGREQLAEGGAVEYPTVRGHEARRVPREP